MKELTKLLVERKWKQVIKYINLWPEEASKLSVFIFRCGTRNTCLPIHLACMRKPPVEVITAFFTLSVTRDKNFLIAQDSMGRCPLHHACRYNASCDVIHVLISLCPDSLYKKSHDGCLPLHLLCLYAKSHTLLKPLMHMLWIMPLSVLIMDDHGLLPKDLVEDNPNEEMREGLRSMIFLAERMLVDDEDTVDAVFTSPSVEQKSLQVTRTHSKDTSSSSSSEVSESNVKLCIVCISNCACRVLLPCGHISLCEECSTDYRLSQMKWKCPECRGTIREAITIYDRILLE
jgi:hypothetical protein